MMQLVKYDAMCKAIEAARTIDDVKEIRDKAKSLQAYSKIATDETSMRYVSEIKARAERKVGELLAGQTANKGGNFRAQGYPKDTLSEIGISKKQSSTWQKIATIPEKKFEQALAESPKPVTTKSLLALVPKPKSPAKPKIEVVEEIEPEEVSSFDPSRNYIKNIERLLVEGTAVSQMFLNDFSAEKLWSAMTKKEQVSIRKGLEHLQHIVTTILEGGIK